MARFETLNVNNIEGVAIYSGTFLPALGTAGFPKGARFHLKNAAGTVLGVYTNRGTSSACAFAVYDFSQVSKAEVMGTGTTTNTWPTSALLTWGLAAQSDAACMFTYNASDDTDRVAAVTTGTATGGITSKFTDPLAAHSGNAAALRYGMYPGQIGYKVVYGAQYTTVGGAAAEAITITGVLASDVAFVGKKSGAQTLVKAVCTANTLTVTFSADPTTANVIYYVILRRATEATVESHVCVFAGTVAATAAAQAGDAKTVTGVKATDLVFGDYATTDDSDTITSVAATADTITYVLSADPLAAHTLNYAVFRAV